MAYNQDPDSLSSELSQLSLELNNRRQNMQTHLQMQGIQTMRSVVHENTSQVALMHNYASKLLDMIHENDAELKAWKQIVLEKEDLVANLTQELEMIQASHHQLMNGSEADAGSSCGDLSKDIIDSDCQVCRKELSCVVMFPCNHLCCCKTCGADVRSCPVCKIPKEGSVEVSWPPMKKVAD